MQWNARNHLIEHLDIDSTVLRVAESDPAVMACADVIKAIVATGSKTDALGYLAASAIARLSLAASAETTPNIDRFDPTNGTRRAF